MRSAYRSFREVGAALADITLEDVARAPRGGALLVIDTDYVIRICTGESKRLLGKEPSEVIGLHMYDAFPGFPEEQHFIDHVLETGETVSAVPVITNVGGFQYNQLVSTFAVHDTQGRLIGAGATFSDISAYLRTQERLHEAEKYRTIGEMAAGVVHEIRNPLTAVRGFLQLAREGAKPEYLDVALAELESALEVVTALLSISRPLKSAASMSLVSICEILDGTLRLFQSESISRGIHIRRNRGCLSLRSECGCSGISIHCNPTQIRQVFFNLVQNALQAMPDGGVLTLNASLNEDEVSVSVSDTGIGIAKDRIPFLGKPFFTTKDSGTGLGLSIVKSILAVHHASLRIESEPGRGSTFTVVFPRDLAGVEVTATRTCQLLAGGI